MRARLALLFTCVTPLAAIAQHPDFTGTWVLDVANSDASQSTPTSATYRVQQHGDSLTYDRIAASSRGETTSHLILGIDGHAWKNSVAQNGSDVPTSSILSWAHDTLVIQSSGDMGGTAVDTYERWSLAPDRHGLLMFREVSVNGQVYASTNLRFVRQGN